MDRNNKQCLIYVTKHKAFSLREDVKCKVISQLTHIEIFTE